MVPIRTGWLEAMRSRLGEFHSSQPGIGLDAARWLAEQDVVAVGADNTAVEQMSWETGHATPNLVHRVLIHEYGIHLMELMNLEKLAEDRVHEFFLVVAPLPIKGWRRHPYQPGGGCLMEQVGADFSAHYEDRVMRVNGLNLHYTDWGRAVQTQPGAGSRPQCPMPHLGPHCRRPAAEVSSVLSDLRATA